jgi:hypothetical protein
VKAVPCNNYPKPTISIIGLLLILAVHVVRAQNTDIGATNPRAAQAIAAVKALCLAGSQFDLKADASGNLTLLKLTPGGQGSVSVNVRESSGAAAIFDDKIRVVADADIRDCIRPYIEKIVDAILTGNQSREVTYQWVSTPYSDQDPAPPFGCGCAAFSYNPPSIKVTNGCNDDVVLTAVRGARPDPSLTMPGRPNHPWMLIAGPGREFANVTLPAGKVVAFTGAQQVFLWTCPRR